MRHFLLIFVHCFHYDISRFLYTLFAAVDANFKLKGKQRHLQDIELMPGLGAYVDEEPFQAHIANYVDQPEVSDWYNVFSMLRSKLLRLIDQHMRITA